MDVIDCVFCSVIAGEAPAVVVRRWPDAIAIRPTRPVAPGHLLVIPLVHVADAGQDPAVAARTMLRAAELAGELPAANLITSKGSAATQTVFHLHLHVVPRTEGDALPLPWTPHPLTPTPSLDPAGPPDLTGSADPAAYQDGDGAR
ncbi:HIT family protein [Sphaerisporangium corydalis]|uniref:HIT family protein n=2 Tax=Sphaerisporangium corydalis TaxID=1441875 RepID=A0ABV9EFV7_9ACTN